MRFVLRGTRGHDGRRIETSVFALDEAHALRIAQLYGLREVEIVGPEPPGWRPPIDPPEENQTRE